MAQLRLAQRLRRPASVHCVKSHAALLQLLREVGPLPGGLLLHAYSGPPEMVRTFAGLGAHFSLSGSLTRAGLSRARALATAARGPSLAAAASIERSIAHIDCSI